MGMLRKMSRFLRMADCNFIRKKLLHADRCAMVKSRMQRFYNFGFLVVGFKDDEWGSE